MRIMFNDQLVEEFSSWSIIPARNNQSRSLFVQVSQLDGQWITLGEWKVNDEYPPEERIPYQEAERNAVELTMKIAKQGYLSDKDFVGFDLY